VNLGQLATFTAVNQCALNTYLTLIAFIFCCSHKLFDVPTFLLSLVMQILAAIELLLPLGQAIVWQQ